jgi:hypothetical protein
MNPRDQKFMNKWEKARKLGQKKYMFYTGGLWALLTGVLIKTMDLFLKPELTFQEIFLNLKFVVFMIVFFILGILLFGFVNWRINEKRYHKLMNEE